MHLFPQTLVRSLKAYRDPVKVLVLERSKCRHREVMLPTEVLAERVASSCPHLEVFPGKSTDLSPAETLVFHICCLCVPVWLGRGFPVSLSRLANGHHAHWPGMAFTCVRKSKGLEESWALSRISLQDKIVFSPVSEVDFTSETDLWLGRQPQP
jgi:hypothetical protein